MKINIIHTADWHADSDEKKKDKFTLSIKQIERYCKTNKVNAIIQAGDIWERSQRFQNNSAVPIVIEHLRNLSKLVDFIFITKGNNSHDEPGSIALLHQLEPNIYAFEYPVVLGVKNKNVTNIFNNIFDDHSEFDYIVSLVPYPTKANFIFDDSIDNNNYNFVERFEQIFEHIGDVTNNYNCPKVLAFHGNVVGSKLSSGQTLLSQDIIVAPSTLQKANHNYYALGHIHLRQEVAPNIVYSGSIYNKNWGETEQKSFEVIEFENGKMKLKSVLLESAKRMIKVEADFVNGALIYDNANLQDNAEYRLRIKVNENERSLITEEKIKEIKSKFGEDVKIEFNIIPVERESRSEKIMTCKSLLDEVEEYHRVTTGKELPLSIKQKVLQLLNERVTI